MIFIATLLLVAGATIAGLAMFWKNIVAWIKKAVNRLKEALGRQPKGTRTFISRAVDGFKNRSKYYYQKEVTKEWEEYVYTKAVDESEVPAEILAKVNMQNLGTEVSTTEELSLQLGVSLNA